MSKKTMMYIWKGLAIFGGIVLGTILVRSNEAAKASNASLTDVVTSELKNATRTKYNA